MKTSIVWLTILMAGAGSLAGCLAGKGNTGHLAKYKFAHVEPEWIRHGEPVIFQEQLWFPQDQVDVLTDDEVMPIGEFNGIKFFVEKVDVEPYNRIYTKFGKNKFRVFKQRSSGRSA